MKKLVMMLLAVILSTAFATEWVPLGNDVASPQAGNSEKEYTWHTYAGGPAYIYAGASERAVYVNVEDFGFSYPVNFGGVQSYLYDAGYTSHYRIYDRDGQTLIWEQEFTTTEVGYEVVAPADPIILNDDFYIVHVPDASALPRIIFDQGDGVPNHSYIGSAGSWASLYGGAYNFLTYVALEQYTGTDVSVPSARFVMGNHPFMNYDANILLAVTDESAITTLTGEYTVDGGTTWDTFTMSASKANYYEYNGVIPGQVDGTTGSVRFVMSDDQGNTGTSMEFPLSWSKDNPLLSEGFEANFPPLGWTLQTTGAGFVQAGDTDPVIDQVYSGNYSAAHFYVASDQDDWLISPIISIPADNSSTLMFWQNNVYTAYHFLHEVAVTTDGGTTWTPIFSDIPTVNNVWEKIYVPLSAYVGQNIQIGFHYVGNDADNWYIDDVAVMYDYEGPTVVDLVGNEALYPIVGAYLNNDMPLTLTVNDLTGVQSVMGYYSFDEGITETGLIFSKAKGGDEIWTATVPQLAAVDSGYIRFDMTDLGGIVNSDPTEYRIDFVLDTDPPIFNFVKGTMAFVNDPMVLEVNFSDESAITSCTGYYSNDNGTTWEPFTMNPAKIHDYTYVGSIPAETVEVLDGQVYFSITDVENNNMSSDTFTVKWLDGQELFFDDFEAGTGNWTLTGNWGLEAGVYISPTNSLSESPNGDYLPDEISTATLATVLDLSAYKGAEVSFWTKYDLETGFDYIYFQGTNDGGATWIDIKTFNGEGVAWNEAIVPMDYFAGRTNVNFRFLFESDGAYEVNGINIDDLRLVTYNVDHGAPSIISDPYRPRFYEGVFGDYTSQIQAYDASGLNEVSVHYSVDGGPEQSLTTVNTEGEWYEFTIPAQVAGSQVEYYIYAQDASPQMNENTSSVYTYIAGDHMIYDSGIVDYYTITTDNAAKAVRATVPGTGGGTYMTGNLAYLLIRNYGTSSLVSEAMTIHVWDDVDGLPGTELITPFDVISEAGPTNTSATTRIDLRSYNLSVTGDFWVGFSAPYGEVYVTMERSTVSGVTAYERSWGGAWDAGTSTWNWAQWTTDNFHFRAVLDGVYSGIEDTENIPMITELKQNYPNPFNPATTINFDLANDAKVSLVVYDVMGREVARLVNGEMSKGSHKVTFDASRLVSGVYYYNLKAGDLNQTKKMMLIK